jgi:hypothetical protein
LKKCQSTSCKLTWISMLIKAQMQIRHFESSDSRFSSRASIHYPELFMLPDINNFLCYLWIRSFKSHLKSSASALRLTQCRSATAFPIHHHLREVLVYDLDLGTIHSPGVLICILSPVLKLTTAFPPRLIHCSLPSSFLRIQ